MDETRNRRILVVDDSEDIHADFRRTLTPASGSADLDALEASLFGGVSGRISLPPYELTSAYQGAEALESVRNAREADAPYALMFVDMRMPPGWDGVETLTRVWQMDSEVQAVICSAYADCSWETIQDRFGQTDRLLILKKPFDPVEVRQMACALTERWNQQRELEAAQRREKEIVEELLVRRAQEEALRARAEALLALSMPIIPISEDIVIMPLIGEMELQRMRRLVEELVEGVASHRARVAILDVTGVPSVNAGIADGIMRAARAVRLLGAEIVLTGIRPELARALIGLELSLSGVTTLQTLQSGVAYAMRLRGAG